MRIALLQLNPTVGDLTGNAEQVVRALRRAEGMRADIAVTPELALTGYPPEDLLLRPGFLTRTARTLKRLSAKVRSTTLVCGHPSVDPGRIGLNDFGSVIKNSASVLRRGRTLAVHHKISLPNYGVFDEARYFVPGARVVMFQAVPSSGSFIQIALSICEDLWPTPDDGYFKALGDLRPDVIINLSASPYDRDKPKAREHVLAEAAKRSGAHVVYVNLVGGQDELIFDGRSLVLSPEGRVLARAAAFQESLLCVDIPVGLGPKTRPVRRLPSDPKKSDMPEPGSAEDVLAALELSLRDYVLKNGFSTVGIAMSGGIDSALVAALAVRALGRDRVIGVTLPSRVTSSATLNDARKQARDLKIRFYQISISALQSQFLQSISSAIASPPASQTQENLQARIRGTIMMALSNQMGFLLLATGNKSELATGYCTLYGDMAGGFAPLKDLTKTWVYRIARAINRLEGREVIPASVLRRAPTAELRPGQKDRDTLPPYPVLDSILEKLVEKDLSHDTLRRSGRYETRFLSDTARRVYQNEYKRRQAPPGPKVTAKAFGRDRRMPITQKNGECY